ncbi:MAG: PAS domain S-box protein [Verrucomicrobiota bacterium]
MDFNLLLGKKKQELPSLFQEETLGAFMENVPGLAWVLDTNGHFVKCNRGICDLLNLEYSKVIGKHVADLFGEKIGIRCEENRQHIQKTREPVQFQQAIHHPNGASYDFLVYEFPIKGESGELLFGGIGLDITGQTETQALLKESRTRLDRVNRLYSVLSLVNECIVRFDTPKELLQSMCEIIVDKGDLSLSWVGKLEASNSSVVPLTSYGKNGGYIDSVKLLLEAGPESRGPGGRAIRTGVYAVSNDIENDASFHYKEEALSRGFRSCGAFPFKMENDERGIFLVYSQTRDFFKAEEIRLFQSLAKDISFALQSISSRKKIVEAQQRLAENQQQLSTLLSNLPGMAYRSSHDDKRTLTYASEGCFDLTGYNAEELEGNREISFIEMINTGDRLYVKNDIELALGRQLPFEITYRIHHRQKGERWVSERGRGIFENGKLKHLEGLITDVTDMQIAYAKLKNQAQLIAQARDAIIVCAKDGTILFWNQGATRLYGYTPDQVQDRKVNDVLVTRGESLDDAQRKVRSGGDWYGELTRVRADGQERTVESRWTMVTGEDNKNDAILSIDTDITERKELEKQFLRAQRLESVGSLAGGIAHDLNNILSPILMSAELLNDKVHDDLGKKLVRRITDGSRRAADLIKQLLSFSRGLDSSRVPIDFSDLIEEMKFLAKDAVTSKIEVDFQVANNLPQIRANPVQINQVLLNLCVNARDAMGESGTLTIRLRKARKWSVPQHITPGNFVVLEVSDTGCGIPKEIQGQIFEPFYTTKDETRGTGLGLSTSLSIIRNHGGFVELDSAPNKGTTFRVFFPALGMRLKNASEDSDGIHGKGQLVLVVDDESSMRSILRQTLESCSFQVELAANGQEAEKFLTGNHKRVELVLTDLNMPLLNGVELAKSIRKRYPHIPVIGMSGFPPESVMVEGEDPQSIFKAFLNKPFNTENLLNLLRDHLKSDAKAKTKAN